jgi:hypothetical protein
MRKPVYTAYEVWDESHQLRASLHQLYHEAQDLDDIHDYAQARTHLFFTVSAQRLFRGVSLFSGARYVLTLIER